MFILNFYCFSTNLVHFWSISQHYFVIFDQFFHLKMLVFIIKKLNFWRYLSHLHNFFNLIVIFYIKIQFFLGHGGKGDFQPLIPSSLTHEPAPWSFSKSKTQSHGTQIYKGSKPRLKVNIYTIIFSSEPNFSH